jgi:hypothetical protein
VRLIARQARPEPAEGDAREIVREVPKEVLPQVLLSDGVAVRAKRAQLKVVICDQIVVASSQPRPWQSFI